MSPHARSHTRGQPDDDRHGHVLMGVVTAFAIAALLLVVCAASGTAIS